MRKCSYCNAYYSPAYFPQTCPICGNREPPMPEPIKHVVTREFEIIPATELYLSTRISAQYNSDGELVDITLKRGQLQFGPFPTQSMETIARGILSVIAQSFSD